MSRTLVRRERAGGRFLRRAQPGHTAFDPQGRRHLWVWPSFCAQRTFPSSLIAPKTCSPVTIDELRFETPIDSGISLAFRRDSFVQCRVSCHLGLRLPLRVVRVKGGHSYSIKDWLSRDY
jgi:hypothetical protein